MPARNQTMIRRDINRLHDTIQRHKDNVPAIAFIEPQVAETAQKVNQAWQQYQQAAIQGDKERNERDSATRNLLDWSQRWRPVILMTVPGARENKKVIPPVSNTPDSIIRNAQDLVSFLESVPDINTLRESALTDLGNLIDMAQKETQEAVAAYPAEAAQREQFTQSCLNANEILVQGTQVIRAVFGRTSPEYKQFIEKNYTSGHPDETDNPETEAA